MSDADTGFADPVSTVHDYILSGAAGLHLEDQVFPKRCGHLKGKELISDIDFANTIKLVVKDKLSEGYNENEIYSFLVSKYGERIVYKPPFSSSNLLLWTLPYIFLLIGAFFLIKIAINKKKFK